MGKLLSNRNARLSIWLMFSVVVVITTFISKNIFAKPANLLGTLNLNYVIIDMASGKYRVSPVISPDPEYFESIISRTKPLVAITGTYFDPDYKPLGDVVINSKVVNRGCQRQGIGFTKSGKIKFFERKGSSRINWHGCESGIACGPRLIRAGKMDIDVKRDGFRPVAAIKEARRCAIGATKDGKLILCVVSEDITLKTMAKVMLELKAVDAINLDGGSLCAFYENKTFKVQPITSMSNILAIYKRK